MIDKTFCLSTLSIIQNIGFTFINTAYSKSHKKKNKLNIKLFLNLYTDLTC